MCFANGWVLPVQDICTRLSKLNPRVPVIVDGAHAIGQLEVSLAGFPFRFYAFSGHKWLFGPPSLGILVLSQEIRLNNDQLHKRLLLEVYEALAVRQGPLDERTSTISLDPLAGLAASIAGIAEPGFPEVWRNLKDLNHTIAHYLVNECEHAEKLPSLGPKVSDGILNVQRKGTRFSLHELRDARERLEREHFVVTKVVSDPLSLRLCIPFLSPDLTRCRLRSEQLIECSHRSKGCDDGQPWPCMDLSTPVRAHPKNSRTEEKGRCSLLGQSVRNFFANPGEHDAAPDLLSGIKPVWWRRKKIRPQPGLESVRRKRVNAA